jgi:hypothetical protein
METETLRKTIHSVWYNTLFQFEIEKTRQQNPRTSVGDLFARFVNSHPDLRQSPPANGGLPLALAYCFLVLPFESDDEIGKWSIQIDSLKGFNLKISPPNFDGATGKFLMYLRHSFAHANIDLNPDLGAPEWLTLWNFPDRERKKPKNFEATCSYSDYMAFLNEFVKKVWEHLEQKEHVLALKKVQMSG